MDLEDKITELNFVEVGQKVNVDLVPLKDGQESLSFETEIIEVWDNNPVELITNFSPEWADENETVALYATRSDDAYEGDRLKGGSEVYAVVPDREGSYEIENLEVV